ncbi:MAG: hypothetical protein O7J95_21465, partial [Planctomycetota bacterium]|nr:hypothetical protein [Planctomycetota bacterium]
MLRKQLGMTLWIGSLAWLSSCATGVQTMPNVPVDGRDTSGEVVGEDRRAALINQMPSPADEHVQRFCAEVASRAGGSSLGCLPLVSYWAQREAPEVTRLGEWFGDEVARGVSAAGFGGWVVDTNGMATLLADMNVERVSLHSLAAVSQRCE